MQVIYPFRWWLTIGVSATAPLIVILISLAMMLFLLAGDTELILLDDGNAPESSVRLIGIGFVFSLNIAVAVLLCIPIIHISTRKIMLRNMGRVLDALSLTALVALGTAFAVFDMSFNVGDSTGAVVDRANSRFRCGGAPFRPSSRPTAEASRGDRHLRSIRRMDHGEAAHRLEYAQAFYEDVFADPTRHDEGTARGHHASRISSQAPGSKILQWRWPVLIGFRRWTIQFGIHHLRNDRWESDLV